MKSFLTLLVCFSLGVLCGSTASSQNYVYNIGAPPLSTQIPIDNGFVNVNNGEIHLEIPLATHTQRGSLQLNERLEYDSRIWKIVANGGYSWQPANVPNSMGGWTFQSGLTTGSLQQYPRGSVNVNCNDNSNGYPLEYYGFTWADPTGTVHTFNPTWLQYSSKCSGDSPEQVNGPAIDASGYTINVSGNLYCCQAKVVQIYDSTGNEVYPSVQDTNGNYWSSDASGNLIDTLGRTPVLTSTNGNQIYYDVLGWNGQRNRYTVTTESISYNTQFGQEAVTESSGSFTAIQSIQLPDGSSYQFTYDTGNYGELTSVTLPSGGTVQFSWVNFMDSFQNENRWLSAVTKDGGTTAYQPVVLSNCSSSNGCQEQTTVTSPDQNDAVYTFTLDQGSYPNASSWISTVDLYQGSTSGGSKLKTIAPSYTKSNGQCLEYPSSCVPYLVPQTVTTDTILPPTNWTSQTTVTLDNAGVFPVSVQQWDYYVGTPPSTPTLTTAYTYGEIVNGANLPTEIKTTDSSNNTVEDTTIAYCYDQGNCGAPQATSGLPNHNTPPGPYGDATSVSQWINNTGTYFTTSTAYDDAGAALTKSDPNGTTTYGHDGTDTFVTTVTLPTPSSGVSLTWNSAYDFSSSLLSSTTDPNSQTTYYKNYDAFGRVGEIDYPDGGKTTFGYTPTQASIYQYQNGSTHTDTEILYDGYERESRRAIANGQGTNPWYQTDTCYDQNGRINYVSYPYQGSGFGMTKACSGVGETTTFDALSRPTSITEGNPYTEAYTINYSYQMRATQVTDELLVSRIFQNDSFGRLVGVCEISSNGNMPGSGSPGSCGLDIPGTGFLTSFQYYLSDHAVTMWQGSQVRSFQTDSLGRTISTLEPEAGQTTYNYTYNSTGLQVNRIRPQANQTNPNVTTTTTTQYDSLGRPVTISYSDGTPTKNYVYDVAQQWGITVPNPAGRLAATSTSGNTGAIYGYDPVGRITLLNECTPSNCGSNSFQTGYTYDWTGNLLTSSDGFGVTDTYSYSPANEVQSIASSLNDSNDPPNIVSSVANGPFGPTSWQLGNGLSFVRGYDSLGRVSGGSICQGTRYPGCSGGTIVDGFESLWIGRYLHTSCDYGLNQCFNHGYDEFGRLAGRSVSEGQGANYSYVYDRWGNRWQQNVTNGGSGPQPNFSFNANNQVTNTGYSYDAAGNLMTDGSGHNYAYDAEGNLTLVDNGATARYTYDAQNQRVRIDDSGSPSIEFVFNPFGQRASVWDATNGWQSQGQTYWGSAPVEFYNNGYAHYQHQDWLGTEWTDTNNTGQVEGTYESLPFGDGFSVSGTDDDTYHFAGMDYDYNSGYNGTSHAQFRQYSSDAGRWMSPDPFSGSYDFTNPQSYNRYSYVLNNPMSQTDRQGLFTNGNVGGGGDTSGSCDVLCVVGDFLQALLGLGGGPHFHGTLKPRPNAQPWDEYHIHYGPNIAGALGIPDAGCEFGVCGTIPGVDFGNGSAAAGQSGQLSPWVFQVFALAHAGHGAAPSNGDNCGVFRSSGCELKRRWNQNWDCVANVGWPVLKADMNPFSFGIGTFADAASQASQTSLQTAATWSVNRGLTVPLRSSVVRAGVGTSEALGRASFILSLASVTYASIDAIIAEHKGCTF